MNNVHNPLSQQLFDCHFLDNNKYEYVYEFMIDLFNKCVVAATIDNAPNFNLIFAI